MNDPISTRREWPGDFGNWNRWPNAHGTLNLLSPERVVRAAGLVRSGTVVSLARPLAALPRPDGTEPEFVHRMTAVGEHRAGRHAAMDRVELDLHSLVNTHLDALAHVGHDGKGFNGVAFDDMVDATGASIAPIDEMPPIVGRGVLVDVARQRGVDHLAPGDYVRPEELEGARSRLEPGDVLLVRTGATRGPRRLPGDDGSSGDPLGDWAGLHVDCLQVVADHDVALLGTDSTTDTFPSPSPGSLSIHLVAEVYLGLPLLHSLDLDELGRLCSTAGRDDFLFITAPLKIAGATGSPVAPVCIL